ncbi:MAG: sugar ABC transporter ATP-binding protein [Chloroflexi bacterium]|nr:sugar ABC transporter ATP-binding protein [Chloroflexota bacterium]
MDHPSPVLEIRGVSKRFDATQALDDVSLTLYPGRVHALLGENGAGKSTLIKIMTGVYQADQGALFLEGKPIQITNAAQAQLHGIAAIYQEPMIFPDLNVAENIFISHQKRGAVVNWRRMYRDAEEILSRLGVSLDVRSQARGLTLAAQQTVEIAKALSLKTRVLIMDEPTASLSVHEVQQLFEQIRTLRDEGVAVLFISHRLEEIFEIADTVTILRDGKLISSAPTSEVTTESAIRDMVGRDMESFFVKDEAERGELLLSVRGLSRHGAFEDISFDIHHGEVLGFAGLVGSGRTDVALALFGVSPAHEGEIIYDGQRVTIHSPDQATRLGIAYVPEDRREFGLVMPMGLSANISLPLLNRYLNRLGIVKRREEDLVAETYRERFSIRTPSIRVPARKLSGGNQQKVVLSKWLNTEPRLLILDEPTRGIDVGAKAEVHHIVNELAKQGLGILLISSDLPEVLAMSDRILVMREGRQMGIFTSEQADQEAVMTAAMGQRVMAGGV